MKQNRKSENASISAYVHPSMTEDPWIGLMKRIESIEKSSISLRSEDGICYSPESGGG